ncbi:hypothetical protein ACIQZB_40970 [Streptomyces sp. NPDC097727]|uniref:hypothetical protein n=1 Tax=Streptomyces sp. NPDC097727 TaxID=3366092 RepID=UPI00381EFB43
MQLASTIAVTRTLGYRVPAAALLTGTAINAITHGILDRRDPLLWLAEKAGKSGTRPAAAPSRIDTDISANI